MKKAIFIMLSIIILSQYVMAAEEHSESKAYGWYIMGNTAHELPLLGADLKFIKNYDAVYANESSGKDTEPDKVIYLTFDAGYENGNVAKTLDVLAAHKAPAAFFVLENIIIRDTALVKRMADEGHLVCNHTARHHDMTAYTNKDEFVAELKSLEEVYRANTGLEMAKFYRPPEGKFNELNLRWTTEMGYKTVFWSFAYADWDNDKQPDLEKAKKKILAHVHPGEIMLLHPTSATNAAILDDILTELEGQGWRFGALCEL